MNFRFAQGATATALEGQLEELKHSLPAVVSPLPANKSSEERGPKFKDAHDLIIDKILERQASGKKFTHIEIALELGYTQAYFSLITGTQQFRARLAERQTALLDPTMVLEANDRLEALLNVSLDKVHNAVVAGSGGHEFALKVAEFGARAKGLGQKETNHNNTQQFVVMVPPKAESATAWVTEHAPR